MRRSSRKRALVPVHSRLEADQYERLMALAEQQDSSLARLVKLAIAEFLDNYSPGTDASQRPDRVNRTLQRG